MSACWSNSAEVVIVLWLLAMFTTLALLVTATSNHCASRTSCGTCPLPPPEGQSPCFWCYDSESCQEVAHASVKPLGGCKNFTFIADDCQCEPKTRTTCGLCAEISHLGCVWANISTTIQTGLDSHHASFPLGFRSSCQAGNGFVGPGTVVRNATGQILGQQWFVALVQVPTKFFWSQCEIPGYGFVVVIALLAIIGLSAACWLGRWMYRCMCGGTNAVQLLDANIASSPRGNDDRL